jgi:L-lactate dehydrogenase complex protein LldE
MMRLLQWSTQRLLPCNLSYLRTVQRLWQIFFMRVALFIPCFIDQLYPRVAEATLRLIQQAGVDEVIFPDSQVCCGQPAFNAGYWDHARKIAAHWLHAFENARADAIVTPSGSCAAMVRHHLKDLFPASDPAGIQIAPMAELAAKTFELTEFLVRVLGFVDFGVRCDLFVALHDSCHHSRLLQARDCPRKLLRHVEGLRWAEPEQAELCCGFGGTFAVKYSPVSSALAARKARNLAATGAEAITGTDMSCLMQIHGWMVRNGMKMNAYHIAEILSGFVQPEEAKSEGA